ncbi:MAG: beta-aspartyl-peptidase [Holophagaceae bacterium]|nr:beta-aspartyl-peptidase [Holophagaceae bacterium]
MTTPSEAPAQTLTLLRKADTYAPEALGLNDVLVGGGKVLWIGKNASDLGAFLAEEVDLEGRRLIPGLIDCHAHVTGGGGEAGAHTRVPAVPLSRFTLGGVTTVVGVLGTDSTTRTMRDLVATVNGLRNEGMGAWAWTGGYPVPPLTLTGSVRDDIAFVDCILGVGELAISDHRSSQPTFDEFLRIASDAYLGGLMTGKAGILHLHVGDGPRGLSLIREALATSELPPRVFHPTHVNRRRALFEEALDLARSGCTIDLTAFPVEAGEDAWSAAEGLRRYLASGAPPEKVTISSDGGGCLPHFDGEGRITRMGVGSPGSLMETLLELTASGEALEKVLPAFTSNPADLLRLSGKGRIHVGGDADLVVLGPAGAVDVMMKGAWFVRSGAALRRGMFEEPEP